jgi:hypothetical protein
MKIKKYSALSGLSAAGKNEWILMPILFEQKQKSSKWIVILLIEVLF